MDALTHLCLERAQAVFAAEHGRAPDPDSHDDMVRLIDGLLRAELAAAGGAALGSALRAGENHGGDRG